jgi:hypothetical protein
MVGKIISQSGREEDLAAQTSEYHVVVGFQCGLLSRMGGIPANDVARPPGQSPVG